MKSHITTINQYLQTDPVTCGVACLMMALHRFKNLELSKKTEMALKHKLRLDRIQLIPAISLAIEAKKCGLHVRVRHEDPLSFWMFLMDSEPELFDELQPSKRASIRLGIKVEHGSISPDEVLSEIDDGSLIIFGLDLGDNIKHAVLLYLREGHMVRLVDPLSGTASRNIEDLLSQAPQIGGSWFIAISEK